MQITYSALCIIENYTSLIRLILGSKVRVFERPKIWKYEPVQQGSYL